MIITKDIKLFQLINLNYHILPVLNRFNICAGFGDKTIAQICSEKNINSDFFLVIINTFLNPNYLPDIELKKFSLSLLIDYLSKTHKYYINKLDELESLLKKVILSISDDKNISSILNFFSTYKQELLSHIQFEDNTIYPLILKLENNPTDVQNKLIALNLKKFKNQHTNVEEKILDIKTLIIKYLPVKANFSDCNLLIYQLFDFERDLFNHQNIEDKVLIPKALEIIDKNL
jgi:regulator of cell morphogenesis and NO signaling